MIDREDLELFDKSIDHATAEHTGDALDTALDDIGWSDALAVDPRAAIATLFERQGRTAATSSALSRLLHAALGGDGRTAVVLPPLGTASPPGTVSGGVLVVRGVASFHLPTSGTALVAATTASGTVAVEVPVADLTVRSVEGIDPSFGLVEVGGEVDLAEGAAVDWAAAAGRARLAIGHELVGASRTMLGLAREHALERIQFGTPIATFQAVRHRLAEALVAIETAEAVLQEAWEDEADHATAMAKALAGRGARTVARHAQQVLAGIGFTTEHDFHRYFRRVLVLDELFGSSRVLTRELGHQLLRDRRLPPVLPL